MLSPALTAAANIQPRGQTWTTGASNDTSQSPTSTCDTGRIPNWTDISASGGYRDIWACQKIIDIINSELSPGGYWTITNDGGDPFVGLLSAYDKCYCSAARVDGLGGGFRQVFPWFTDSSS
ncbi:hypothetical protein diail_6883 [Diaporthe ilicicola]|nr:hypothetical protein diail_6883 [Diaporthe ilicicola]